MIAEIDQYTKIIMYRFLEFFWCSIIAWIVFKSTLDIYHIVNVNHWGFVATEITKSLMLFTGFISLGIIFFFGFLRPFSLTNEAFKDGSETFKVTANHIISFLAILFYCWSGDLIADTTTFRRISLIGFDLFLKTLIFTTVYFALRKWLWKG